MRLQKKRDIQCAEHGMSMETDNIIHTCPFAKEVIVNGEVGVKYHDPISSTNHPVKGTPQEIFSYPYTSCLLLLVEAKHHENVEGALGQLMAYLAIVRANRLHMQKTNPHITVDVYGLATDGLRYIFLAIDATGTVLVAQPVWLTTEENVREIVGTITSMLEGELARRQQTLFRSTSTTHATGEEMGLYIRAAHTVELAEVDAMVDANVLDVTNVKYMFRMAQAEAEEEKTDVTDQGVDED
ncbi:hypothetical protein DFH27DRAFT_610137 [Peziza echinospora]|nr:hypothetical protein DFH27DRAFT_610137 [Peziza echinospora]